MKAQNGGQQDLLPAGERIDAAPQWFQDALANTPQDKKTALNKLIFIIANGPGLMPMRPMWFWCMAAVHMRAGMTSLPRF